MTPLKSKAAFVRRAIPKDIESTLIRDRGALSVSLIIDHYTSVWTILRNARTERVYVARDWEIVFLFFLLFCFIAGI